MNNEASASCKQVSTKTYFVITFDLTKGYDESALKNWMEQNHAIPVHKGCLLLYDEISLTEAHKKAFSLFGEPRGIKVFPVASTFLYGEDKAFDDELQRLRGHSKA